MNKIPTPQLTDEEIADLAELRELGSRIGEMINKQGRGSCRRCKCGRFSPRLFEPWKCNNCFHGAEEHI